MLRPEIHIFSASSGSESLEPYNLKTTTVNRRGPPLYVTPVVMKVSHYHRPASMFVSFSGWEKVFLRLQSAP